MRIHHHVSIILFVAIAGAIGLAVTVGVLLGSLERAARSAGKAAEQYRQVQTVVTGARELQETVESLGPESGEAAFTMLDQDFERAVLDLANLRHSALLDDPLPVEEAMLVLETMARQGRRLAERQAAGILQPEEVQQFRDGISLFMKRLYGVGHHGGHRGDLHPLPCRHRAGPTLDDPPPDSPRADPGQRGHPGHGE
ncbi:MAG: hypothetical protein ACYTFF_08355 [Planctomycetota bacterium]